MEWRVTNNYHKQNINKFCLNVFYHQNNISIWHLCTYLFVHNLLLSFTTTETDKILLCDLPAPRCSSLSGKITKTNDKMVVNQCMIGEPLSLKAIFKTFFKTLYYII